MKRQDCSLFIISAYHRIILVAPILNNYLRINYRFQTILFFNKLLHLRVSAHFLIRRTGEIIQFVSTQNKAWHAGISSFEGKAGCNDFSLGIELEGSDYVPFTDEQYCSLTALSALLRYHYPLRAVRGHEHIAPVRKTDPGPYFDWNRYRSEGKWSWRELPTLG